MKPTLFSFRTHATAAIALSLSFAAQAQVNSGSDGSDGPFNPTAANTVVNMAPHPNGIYQYTSVNIPATVTVTFIPNANNTPVVWLVQNNVVINGTVDLSGNSPTGSTGGLGGPGGYRGGTGGPSPTSGQGPGGGPAGTGSSNEGGDAYYTYGNSFLVPLLGGSGGGGYYNGDGGGGGGGAILIAASATIQVNGRILCDGGLGQRYPNNWPCGLGSGGAIRIVCSGVTGSGNISAGVYGGGGGRVRFDTYENDFGGNITGAFTQGSQFVIIPTAGQLPQLAVASVGGVPVSASPTGVLSTPDAVISAQQANPIPIVVQCSNLPMNTAITVSVKPMNGLPVSAVGYNNTGTQASSTATVSLNMPRGGGLIYATAATGN